MASVLVTGASGFIGQHLVPALRAAGHDVIETTVLSGDIADDATWLGFPKATVVVHLAARTFVPDSWKDPADFLRTNLIGAVCALDYCRTHDATMVFMSSYLYGTPESLPIPESAEMRAENPYALSKKLAEEACRFFADRYGVKVRVLRPFNVYGPGQPDSFLVPSLISQIVSGSIIQVHDLEPKRDYVYIDDVVDAIVRAAELDGGFTVLNIGTGLSHSVAELIDLLQDLHGTHLPVQASGERRPQEIMDTRADITRAGAVLGWAPKVSLQAGLSRMLPE